MESPEPTIANRKSPIGLQARISLLVTLGLGLIFAFLAWEGMQAMETAIQMILQERRALARTVALHLDQDLERTLSRLAQVAAFPTINLDDGDLEPEKRELRALYRPDLFSYVFLLDKDGLVLWTEPYLPDVVGVKRLECPHVQEALRTGQPGIACVAHALTPQSPVIAPVVAIRNREGTVIGILGAAIDPSSPDFTYLLRRVVPGRTGYAQLVDENGLVMTHTEGRRLFQKSEHADLFTSLFREKKAAVTADTVTEEGKGTFREVIAFAPLTVAPWGVAVEQEEAELLAPALQLRRRTILFAAAALAAAFLLVWVTARRFVIVPVRRLVAASERIAAGDLTTAVPPLGQDEIGDLGRAFDDMRQRLARWGEELETAVQKRTRELSTLYTIDRAVAQSLDLEQVLNDAVEATLQALGIEAGGIFLLEPDAETMILRVYRGISDEFFQNVQRIKLGEGVSGRAAAEKKPVVLDVADYPTERLAPFIVQEGIQTLASTPLLSAGKLVGALNLATRRPHAFPPEELDLLTAIGWQLGQAVANAQLHQETQRTRDYLQSVLDSSIDLIFTVQPDGTFGYFNPRLTEITGYEAEAIRGRPFLDFIPEDRRAFMLQKWQELTQGSTYETEISTADGRRIPVLVSHSVITGFNEYLAILRDISDLKAAERELEQRAERLTVLNHIARALSATLDLDKLLGIVHREVTAVLEVDAFLIALYDRAANELDYRIRVDKGVREPPERRGLGTGLTSLVVTAKEPLLIRDFQQEKEQYPQVRLWGTMQAPASWLGVPMLLVDPSRPPSRGGEEMVVGVISVQAYRPNAYGEQDQQLLSTIADAVGVAIENARLFEAERRQAQEMAALVELNRAITEDIGLQETLDRILSSARKIIPVSECSVTLVDEASGDLLVEASTNGDIGLRLNPAVPSAVGWVVKTKQLLAEEGVSANPIFDQQLVERYGIKSGLVVPIIYKDKAIGALGFADCHARRVFSDSEKMMAQTFANQAAIAIENARLYQSLQESKAALEAKVHDLERFTRHAVDRELRMKELKERIEELENRKREP